MDEYTFFTSREAQEATDFDYYIRDLAEGKFGELTKEQQELVDKYYTKQLKEFFKSQEEYFAYLRK